MLNACKHIYVCIKCILCKCLFFSVCRIFTQLNNVEYYWKLHQLIYMCNKNKCITKVRLHRDSTLTLNFDVDMCCKMRVICPFVCLSIRRTRCFSIKFMTRTKYANAFRIDDDHLLTVVLYYAIFP